MSDSLKIETCVYQKIFKLSTLLMGVFEIKEKAGKEPIGAPQGLHRDYGKNRVLGSAGIICTAIVAL